MEQQKKYCKGCDTIKILDEDFYKAGASHQKYCKSCHNSNRKYYAQNPKVKERIKKELGFKKIDEETRKNILHDISIKINYKEIAAKYNLVYQSLVLWKRQGKLV